MLPAIGVDPPTGGAKADAACPKLISALPTELRDLEARVVRSTSSFVAAWGEPPVTLRCGVVQPPGYRKGAELVAVNGVTWLVQAVQGGRFVWTSVDRPVFVEVSVPEKYASAPVAVLAPVLAKTLPTIKITPPD